MMGRWRGPIPNRRPPEIILAALRETGAGPEHVVRTRIDLMDAHDGEAVGYNPRRRNDTTAIDRAARA